MANEDFGKLYVAAGFIGFTGFTGFTARFKCRRPNISFTSKYVATTPKCHDMSLIVILCIPRLFDVMSLIQVSAHSLPEEKIELLDMK